MKIKSNNSLQSITCNDIIPNDGGKRSAQIAFVIRAVVYKGLEKLALEGEVAGKWQRGRQRLK